MESTLLHALTVTTIWVSFKNIFFKQGGTVSQLRAALQLLALFLASVALAPINSSFIALIIMVELHVLCIRFIQMDKETPWLNLLNEAALTYALAGAVEICLLMPAAAIVYFFTNSRSTFFVISIRALLCVVLLPLCKRLVGKDKILSLTGKHTLSVIVAFIAYYRILIVLKAGYDYTEQGKNLFHLAFDMAVIGAIALAQWIYHLYKAKRTAEEYQKQLEEKHESDRNTAIIHQIVHSSRTDAEIGKRTREALGPLPSASKQTEGESVRTGIPALDEEIGWLQHRADTLGVSLHCTIREPLTGLVKAGAMAPDEVFRVAANLLNNGLDSAAEGQARKAVHMILGRVMGVYCIDVIDTGPYFSRNVLERLGKPGNSTKPEINHGYGYPILIKALIQHSASLKIEEYPPEQLAFRTKRVTVAFDGLAEGHFHTNLSSWSCKLQDLF